MNPKDISIEADLDELSAVVTYVVETTYLDAFGVAVDSEKVKHTLMGTICIRDAEGVQK